MTDKAKQKKVTQWAIVASIVAVILVMLYLAKKTPVKKTPAVEGEFMGYDETENYLTYNLPGAYVGPSGSGGRNITLGDTIINMGSALGGSNFSPCNAGGSYVSLPGSNTYNVNLPPPVTATSGGGNSSNYVSPDFGGDLPEYTRYKCDDVKLIANMKKAAEMQGVDYQTLIAQNMYVGSERVMARWLSAQGLPYTSPIGGMPSGVDLYFEPYSNKQIKGKPVKYTVQMACECKRGNTAYCGQWLSPPMLAMEDAPAGS